MIRQVLKLLKSGRVAIVHDSIEEWGLCDWDEKTLYIRKSLSERNKVTTIIHECIHYLYPNFEEETVLCIERDVFKHLTDEEYNTLRFYIL